MTEIRLFANKLNGSLPPELSQLRYLEHLELGANRLTGSIPQSIADLPNLMHISLYSNHLDGPIPDQLGLNQPLDFVDLSENSLTGEIPSNLITSESLVHLSLSANRLTGGIPREFHVESKMEHLNLADNQLTFEIPFEIERLQKLRALSLHDNLLTDQIPATLGVLPQLSVLSLSYNQLIGPIPNELSQLDKLNGLFLDNNQLTGTIPSGLATMPNLMSLGIADNNFIGCIPTELRNIKRSDSEYANVTYCDEPSRSEPFTPPYIEWAFGDSVTPSQELAARMGVERIANFIARVGWPPPSKTITVYFGDIGTVARSYADRTHRCDITCARWRLEVNLSDTASGAVFARTWKVGIGSLDEQARHVAYETIRAITHSWLADRAPFADPQFPSWLDSGLPTLIERLANAEARNVPFRVHRVDLAGNAMNGYKPLEYMVHPVQGGCADHCGAMAIEILAAQVGLKTLINYYTERAPGSNWQQTFEQTFNITVLDFYDLYREHYENAFPYLEIPLEGSTQWPWHVTADE